MPTYPDDIKVLREGVRLVKGIHAQPAYDNFRGNTSFATMMVTERAAEIIIGEKKL